MANVQQIKAAGADFEAGWSAAQNVVSKAMDLLKEGSPEREMLWGLWVRDMGPAARQAARAAYVEEIYPDAAAG